MQQKNLFTGLYIIISFSLLYPNLLLADNKDNTYENQEQVTQLTYRRPNKRPNKPSNIALTCFYRTGHIKFELSDEIQSLQLTLGDEMFPIWKGSVNKTYPEVYIPPIIGETPITCEDDRGRKYHGILNFKEYKDPSLHL